MAGFSRSTVSVLSVSSCEVREFDISSKYARKRIENANALGIGTVSDFGRDRDKHFRLRCDYITNQLAVSESGGRRKEKGYTHVLILLLSIFSFILSISSSYSSLDVS